MNQNGKALNEGRNPLSGVSILWTDPFRSRFLLSGDKLALCFAILLLIGNMAECAEEADKGMTVTFLAEGVLRSKLLRISNEYDFYYATSTVGWEIRVSGSKWQIKLGTENPAVYDSATISSDGTNVYLLFDYQTRIQRAKDRGVVLPDNVGDGTVARGIVPRFQMVDEVGAVWLAYGSSYYFWQNASSEFLQVPFGGGTRASPVQVGDAAPQQRCLVDLLPGYPHLPRQVTYFFTNLVEESELPSFGKLGQVSFTNVVFRCVASTNVASIELPMKSVVTVQRPNPQIKDRVVGQVYSEFEVELTNVAGHVNLPDFRPSLPGKTIITDQRFNDGTNFGFAYFQTNGWPSDSVAKGSPAYADAKRRHELNSADKHRPKGAGRVIILGALAFSSGIMFFWLLRQFTKRSKSEGG